MATSTFIGTENPLSEGGAWTDNPGDWGSMLKADGAYAGGTSSSSLYAGADLADDQYSEITYDQDPGAASWVGVTVRGDANNDCYLAIAYDSSVRLYEAVSSGGMVFTQIGSNEAASTGTSPRRLRLEAEGTELRVYFNDALLITETDATFTTGNPGIAASVFGGPTVKITAWEGDDLNAGQSVNAGLATETDSAFALGTTLKTKAVGLASETDSALGAAWTKAKTLGLVTETDSAFGVTGDDVVPPPANPWYEGKTIYVLDDVTGLVEWVDYIPIEAAPDNPGRFDTDGSFPVIQVLSVTTGVTAWVDYIPVYVVDRTKPWTTDAEGYTPYSEGS